MSETFVPPVLYTLGDLLGVGLAGFLLGAFVAAVFFVVARGAE